MVLRHYAPSPLHTSPVTFPVDRKVVHLLPTCWQQVVVMEFGKRHDTRDTTDFCPRQLVTDLLRTCRLSCGFVRTCYGEVADLLQTCYGETGVTEFGFYAVLPAPLPPETCEYVTLCLNPSQTDQYSISF